MYKQHERAEYMKAFLHGAFYNSAARTLDDTVLTLARSIYSITNNKFGVEVKSMDWYDDLESRYFFNMSSTVALKYGTYGVRGHYVFGPCGTMSRLLMNSLWQLDIPARKLQLLNNEQGKGGGHTLVEYKDGEKWKVIAVSDNAFVWRNSVGEIASVDEIQHQAGVFNQIYAQHPTYPYLFDNPKHLNWTKVPKWIQNVLKNTIGTERMSAIETPQIYDRPRLLLLYLSLGLFIISMTASLQLRASLRKSEKSPSLRDSAIAMHRSMHCPPHDLLHGASQSHLRQRSSKQYRS